MQVRALREGTGVRQMGDLGAEMSGDTYLSGQEACQAVAWEGHGGG